VSVGDRIWWVWKATDIPEDFALLRVKEHNTIISIIIVFDFC